jgi:hypothetical protein
MPNPMIRIHDIATGEVIDREMTATEIKERNEEMAKSVADKKATEQNLKDKEALLAKLGITAEEAQLLLG